MTESISATKILPKAAWEEENERMKQEIVEKKIIQEKKQRESEWTNVHQGIKDIESYPWIFDLKDPNLYFENPTILDAEFRAKLDAFKDKDPNEPNWAWFVQSTKKISKHDFEILTKSK